MQKKKQVTLMEVLKSHKMGWGDSTELIGGEREKRGGGGGIRGLGECEEIDMEKEEKITNVI